MMQAAEEGKASYLKMASNISSISVWTKNEEIFNKKYMERKARKFYLEVFNPVKVKGKEDRRVKWLTFGNINKSTDVVKQKLMHIGIVIDKPGK